MTRDFYGRFGLSDSIEESKKKFVNRALNYFADMLYSDSYKSSKYYILQRVATVLGVRYFYNVQLIEKLVE